MMMTDDLLATLEKLDQQLVRLIADRRDMIAQIPGGLSTDQEMEIMSLWIDEAVERELPEDPMEKMGKMLNQICRRRGE
jgi:chorismate mutase